MTNEIRQDTETTNLNSPHSNIIELGMIVTDPNLYIIDKFEVNSRLDRTTLLSPSALNVHKKGISEIEAAAYSQYEFTLLIHEKMQQHHPGIYLGYNFLGFDYKMLQHGFYRNLLPSYSAQQFRDGSASRVADSMYLYNLAVRVGKGLERPDNYNPGKAARLTELAAASGVNIEKAHSALGDAMMDLELGRKLKESEPEIYEILHTHSQKRHVDRLVRTNGPLIWMDMQWGGCNIRFVTFIAQNPDRATELYVADLGNEPGKNFKSQGKVIDNSGKERKIHKIKTNAFPMIFPLDDPRITSLVGPDASNYESQANLLQQDAEFENNILDTMLKIQNSYPQRERLEERLYEGFPSNSDLTLMAQFHEVEPSRKRKVLGQISDERYRKMGLRLIYNEWPELLTSQERLAFDKAVYSRLNTREEVPWMTIPSALEEIEAKRASLSEKDGKLFDEYKAHLLRLKALKLAA